MNRTKRKLELSFLDRVSDGFRMDGCDFGVKNKDYTYLQDRDPAHLCSRRLKRFATQKRRQFRGTWPFELPEPDQD